jgi:coenzyme Q-binding protein COQ10
VPRVQLAEHIAAPIELVYQVVADVERYPEFLPDVARVERTGDVVAMTLRAGLVPVRLVTRATFTPPHAIDLELVEGPFRAFRARWRFAETADGADVAYTADYELPLFGALFAGTAGRVLEQATRRQLRAFESRVRLLMSA